MAGWGVASCETRGGPGGVRGRSRNSRACGERARGHDEVGLDWHAHNDRGLALPTASWASEVGVELVHGTVLGIGERLGNGALGLLPLDLGLMGSKPPVSGYHAPPAVRGRPAALVVP